MDNLYGFCIKVLLLLFMIFWRLGDEYVFLTFKVKGVGVGCVGEFLKSFLKGGF